MQYYRFKCRLQGRFVIENFPLAPPQLSLYINEKIPFLHLKQTLMARFSIVAVPSIKSLQLGVWSHVVKLVDGPESLKPKKSGS